MLKRIPPIIGPDLLHALRAMGHGDRIAIVDANFPAASVGARLIRADGVAATDLLDAVLTLLPLDDFVDDAFVMMEVVGDSDRTEPVMRDFEAIVARHEPARTGKRLERFAFYRAVAEAQHVVATGERRLYGNVLLRKGIIRPE